MWLRFIASISFFCIKPNGLQFNGPNQQELLSVPCVWGEWQRCVSPPSQKKQPSCCSFFPFYSASHPHLTPWISSVHLCTIQILSLGNQSRHEIVCPNSYIRFGFLTNKLNVLALSGSWRISQKLKRHWPHFMTLYSGFTSLPASCKAEKTHSLQCHKSIVFDSDPEGGMCKAREDLNPKDTINKVGKAPCPSS